MDKSKQILSKCFNSESALWADYLRINEKVNLLYYPSAGPDFRPFIFAKSEFLNIRGLNTSRKKYFDPNLIVLSDYHHDLLSDIESKRIFQCDDHTSITIVDHCYLRPNPDHFMYQLNPEFIEWSPSPSTENAVFFKAKVRSLFANESCVFGLYFCYENVNLIDQLFLRHRLKISHLIWKRDGSGLGGGRVKHNFLYPVSKLLGVKWFFIWDFYLNEDTTVISDRQMNYRDFPDVISNRLDKTFTLRLEKLIGFKWEIDDSMNLYKSVNY